MSLPYQNALPNFRISTLNSTAAACRSRLERICAAALTALSLTVLAPAAMASNAACGDAIRIARGDTLMRVADYCHTTIGALLAANPQIANPNVVHVGELVWMPGRNSAVASRRPAVPASPTALRVPDAPALCGATVQVRPGDTFAGIARRCGASVGHMRQANPQVRNPDLIRSGMVLRVPSYLAAQSPRQAAPRELELVRITGTVTTEGVICQAMRGDDGRLYTFNGAGTRSLRPGDRIEVTGTRADVSICQQGMSINIDRVMPLDAVPRNGIDVTGTITREGTTCTALRGDDGRLYTLAADTDGFRPGDRVRIIGDAAELSFCQQGTTVNLRSIRHSR